MSDETRWRFLHVHPLADDIELRLRQHHSGAEVEAWLRRESQPVIDGAILESYVAAQGEGWRLPVLRPGTSRSPRLLPLELQAQAITTMMARIQQFRAMELPGGATGGLPIPEIRENLELLDRMIERHAKLLLESGVIPRAPKLAAAVVATTSASADAQADVQLVRRLLAMPPEQFYGGLLDELLGPPPMPYVEPTR